MNVDLHTHSTASDGALTPLELIERARRLGVKLLSLTDHDTLDGYSDIDRATLDLRLIPGVEFSTQCDRIGIHVLGLNVDPDSDAMIEAVRFQSDARSQRALRIGEKLENRGFKGIHEQASALAGDGWIGRPQFAQALVQHHGVPDLKRAYGQYLGPGKTGDVRQHWADLARIVEWIRAASGTAALAHPLHYRLTATRLRRLLASFIEAGGTAMEVCSGQQNPESTRFLADLCEQSGLLASCGSDFHRPGQRWQELGHYSSLPRGPQPLWEQWL